MNFLFKNFHLFYLLTLFDISSEKQLYDDDNVLLEYVKDPSNFEKFCAEKGFNDSNMNEFLMQKYKAHLGVLYELRKIWHCAKIGKQFEEYERTECQTFRKYLDILYEFLFRVYAGLPAVNPMFYFDKIFTFCQMTEVISTLSAIWQFFSNPKVSEKRGHKMERFFVKYYEPKLYNEKELNYTANFKAKMAQKLTIENQIIARANFDEMLKRFNELVKEKFKGNEMKYPLNFINTLEWGQQAEEYLIEERAFAEFVRGPSYFEQFCNELKNDDEVRRINTVLDFTLPRRYEIVLGLLYLMKKNWNCAKIVAARNEERKLCEKVGNYLNILYEYLFTVYAKTENPKLAKEMPIVKPWFLPYVSTRTISNATKLIEVVRIFNHISMELSERLTNKYYFYQLNLLNEDKLSNYKANFGNLNAIRKRFDEKLKIMFKNEKEIEEGYTKDSNYLQSSPFYDKIIKRESKALIAFVTGKSNFEKFCNGNEKVPKKKVLIRKKYFTQKFESHLGILYLMKENWHCAKIVDENAGQNRADCKIFRKYFNIFYESLFTMNAEAEGIIKTEDLFKMNPNPLLLIRKIERFGSIIDVVKYFNQISKFYFDSNFAKDKNYELKNVLTNKYSLIHFVQIFKLAKQNEEITFDMKPFDKRLKEFFEIASEKALKEKREIEENNLFELKLSKLIGNKLSNKSAAFEDKFGILFDSPFYDFGSKEKNLNLKVKGQGKEKTHR